MSPVRLDLDGPLAVLTLDAPPLNLFDAAMIAGSRTRCRRSTGSSPARAGSADPGQRTRGVGGGGESVVTFVFEGRRRPATELWRDWFEMIHAIENLPFPTVFAAHAPCLTAATFEISLGPATCCWRRSRPSSALVEIVVGLTPSMGGPQRLAERAGPARARELIYTGGLYSAATLEQWNVVNRVLPDEGFAEAARAFAMALANGPTKAHAATKTIIRAQLTGWRPCCRRGDAGDQRRPVRDGGPAERGRVIPARRPRQGNVRRPVAVSGRRRASRAPGSGAAGRATATKSGRSSGPARRRLSWPARQRCRHRGAGQRDQHGKLLRGRFSAPHDAQVPLGRLECVSLTAGCSRASSAATTPACSSASAAT